LDKSLCERFGLRNGQFFAYYQFKNLHWHLGEKVVGFGDLREEDVARIQAELRDGEVFFGYHESHGTEHQMRDTPLVFITNKEIVKPKRL